MSLKDPKELEPGTVFVVVCPDCLSEDVVVDNRTVEKLNNVEKWEHGAYATDSMPESVIEKRFVCRGCNKSSNDVSDFKARLPYKHQLEESSDPSS